MGFFLQSCELSLGTYLPSWDVSSSIQHYPFPWLDSLWLLGDPNLQHPEAFLSKQGLLAVSGTLIPTPLC